MSLIDYPKMFLIQKINKFLKSHRIKSRLYLIFFIFLFPILILSYLIFTTQSRAIQFGKKEIKGLEYNQVLVQLVSNYHKNLFYALEFDLTKNENLHSKMKSIFEKNQNLIADLEKIETEHGNELNSLNQFREIFLLNKEILNSNDIKKTEELLKKLLDSIFQLNTLVGDTSNLILDPDLDSYYLMDLTLIKLPTILQKKMEIENLLFQVYKTKKMNDEILIKLFAKSSELNSFISQSKISIETTYKYNQLIKSKLEGVLKSEFEGLEKYKSFISDFSNPESKIETIPSFENFSENSFTSFESVQSIYKLSSIEQKKLLEIRINNFIKEQIYSFLFVLFILLITAILLLLIIQSISEPLLEAEEKFSKMAEGFVNLKISYDGKDEIGSLAKSINTFIEFLSSLIQLIKEISNESILVFNKISLMSEELRSATHNQSASTEESAAALEEVSSSFKKISVSIFQEANDIVEIGDITDQISNSIQVTAKSVYHLSEIAKSSEKEAKEAEEFINETVESMNQIKLTGEQIAKITTIITEISKQTSLLALNASIEAARAGEFGSGFSIVAKNISKLSELTNQSVTKIKKLTSSSEKALNLGIYSSINTNKIITELIDFIEFTSTHIENISTEMKKQNEEAVSFKNDMAIFQNTFNSISTLSLDQKGAVNVIMETFDYNSSLAQTSSASSEELASISEQLNLKSIELKKIVGEFRV